MENLKMINFKLMAICFVLISSIFLSTNQLFGQTILVNSGVDWKYLDDGSDQGTAWYDPAFIDTAWASGPAKLGYGEGDEATVISYGPNSNNKYRTYYFRHSFNVTNPSQYLSLILGLLRDDGAIVYLNGVELERSNMPAGPINYLTFAASTVSGSDEDTFFESFEDPVNLINGSNVLAVEVHQRTATSSDVSFDLRLIGSTELPDLTRKAPYLIYNGNSTEMKVLWQLRSTEMCTIEWGLDTLYSVGNVQTSEGNDHQHSYTIPNLAVDTKYYYQVTANQENHKGSFRSALDSNATNLKFFAYGDTRTYPASHNQVAAGIINTFTEDEDYQSLIIVVADLVNDGDIESDWDSQFFDPSYPNIQKMLASLPYQSCMGNHEGSGVLFQKYFPYPYEAGRYWSFDYGPAHFVVVDQYTSYGPGSAQLAWIENDLASTNKLWKFVYLHEPGWSAGGHGNEPAVQNAIQPLCEQYGVPIVFGGHNHYYARAVVNNVHHITTGGGGAPLYAPIPTYPNLVTTSMSLHFCKIEIDSNLLILTVENPSGVVLDSFTVDNHTTYANEVTLSHTYLQPGIDNLIINAPIINNGGHNVELKAFIISTDSSYQDSLLLYDDGSHNDGAAGDGIYGNLMFAPGIENEFMVGVKTFDIDYNTTIIFDDLARFTTAGPVVFNGYSIIQRVGQILFTEINLLNSGSTAAVTGIRAIISSNDPKIISIANNNQSFGNIDPGQTSISQSHYSINTTNLQPIDTLNLNIAVYSNNKLFWKDSTASLVVGIPSDNNSISKNYSLQQNYPNPFNLKTTIEFSLPISEFVTLKIYDNLGREIQTLSSKTLSSGKHNYKWDAQNVSSGVYIYMIKSGNFIQRKKLLLLK
jgi:calcineurin-like phosphoesterase family protein/type IX secretion system substrate protein